MKYRGPQPKDGDVPSQRYEAAMAPVAQIVELLMAEEPAKGDARWARLGMLQRVLEAGMNVTPQTLQYALRDCKYLADINYPGEWPEKRQKGLWGALAAVTEALEELEGDGEVTNLLASLGRETLLTEAAERRLKLLWVGKAG